jgi:hypothetical protein
MRIQKVSFYYYSQEFSFDGLPVKCHVEKVVRLNNDRTKQAAVIIMSKKIKDYSGTRLVIIPKGQYLLSDVSDNKPTPVYLFPSDERLTDDAFTLKVRHGALDLSGCLDWGAICFSLEYARQMQTCEPDSDFD